MKAHVVEYFMFPVIRKRNMLEIDGPVNLSDLTDICGIRDLRFGVKHFKNTLGARNIRHNLIIKTAQIIDRLPEHVDIGSECKEGTKRHLIHAQDHNSGKIQADAAKSPCKINDGTERIADADRALKRIAVFMHEGVKRPVRLFLRRKALNHAHARHILMNERI